MRRGTHSLQPWWTRQYKLSVNNCTDTILMGCPNTQVLCLPLPELLAHTQAPERYFLFSRNFSIQLSGQESALLPPLSHWDTVGKTAQHGDHSPQLLHFSAVLRGPFITQLLGFLLLFSSSQT